MEKPILDKLIELIKIDSYAYKKEGILAAQQFVKDYLSQAPISWKTYESTKDDLAPILLGRSRNWNNSKPTITLCGHLDIVYPNIDNMEVKIISNKLYGPGAADMKAGVLVILETVKKLVELNLFTNVQILLTSEEEQYQTRFYPIFRDIAISTDYLFVYEGAGSLDKEPDYKKKGLVIKRKGILGYRLSAKAKGGHSGGLAKREERHSAVHELIYQSKQILNFADFDKGTTLNIGKFNGGKALNILAENAEIEFDARLNYLEEFERVKKRLDKIKPNDLEVRLNLDLLLEGPPVIDSAGNKSLFEIAQQAGNRAGVEVFEESKSGASDMNRLVGFNPQMASIDYLGPSGGGEHTSLEFLYLDSFEPSVKLSIELLSMLINKLTLAQDTGIY